MFFNAEDDESDFLSPSSGSKLGALFGIDQASSQGGNESLKYSAPKQPRKKTDAAPGGAAPAVLNAAAVQAYKYTDGQYAKQGKLGAAVLGNHSSQDYKILLYVSKQQQVTNAKIYSGFTFTVQPNNYASFYDDARQSWSIMFDNEASAIAFTKQVCLAKALSGGPAQEVVTQDLTLGEGGPLETGDSAEVKYTGWLLSNNTFGKVFDSNTNAEKLFRFKLGKGKVIKGWDIGIIGMKKNGRRLLVVPPVFAYGDQGMGDRVPSNSTLIFEIEVFRVKLSKSDSPTESPAPTPPVSSAAPSSEDADEITVKGRTRSITEQLAQSPKSDKAKLISRMAKMGQPMLPMSGAVAASPEDDDEDEPENTQYYNQQQQQQQQQQSQPVQPAQSFPVQPQMVPANAVPMAQPTMPQYQPHLLNQAPPTAVNHMSGQPMMQQQQPAFVQNLPSQQLQQQQLSLYQPIQPPVQQPQAFQPAQPNPNPYGAQPVQPYNNMYPAPSYPGGTPGTDVNTPLLMSEARQQNTEVRLAVGKVADKVDKILEKLEHIQVHGSGSSLAVAGNTPPMENGILLHNIQKVIQENERLKKELFEKSARIESQNEKIGDLLQRNQRYVEQSNLLLEQRNDTFKSTAANSQARVLTLEQEKVQIATELSVATAQISSLQLELSALRKKEGDMKQQLSTVLEDTGKNKDEMNRLRIAHSDEERKAAELAEVLKEEKLSRKQLENQVSQMKEEMTDLKLTNETLEKNLSERKKKSGEERRKLEEELEEAKAQYEEEIQSLKNKLRKQKSSTDAATAEQAAQLEKEITEEWQEKTEKMMKAAEEKHKRALREVEEEKTQAQQNVKDLEKKIQGLKSSGSDSDQKIAVLQSRVEELEVWKDKYDNLRSQAAVMKERYEERITELEERLTETSTAAAKGGNSQDVASEVKKIMSSVYHSLRGQLEAEKSYEGQETLALILSTIKSETLKMVKNEGGKAEESEEESEEEEEESEEEEEEEEVVVETISAQSAKPTQGVSPSKATSGGKKEVKKEERTMEEIEDSLLSQLVGAGGMTVTDGKPEKQASKGMEDVITASTNKITGDKGNKYYSEELDKSKAGKSDIKATVEPTVKSAEGKTEIREVIEPIIRSEKDAITGDKGNRYHSEELDKGKGGASDKSEEDSEEDSEDTSESESESESRDNDIVVEKQQADSEAKLFEHADTMSETERVLDTVDEVSENEASESDEKKEEEGESLEADEPRQDEVKAAMGEDTTDAALSADDAKAAGDDRSGEDAADSSEVSPVLTEVGESALVLAEADIASHPQEEAGYTLLSEDQVKDKSSEEATEEHNTSSEDEERLKTERNKERSHSGHSNEVTIKGEADEESQASEDDQNDADAGNIKANIGNTVAENTGKSEIDSSPSSTESASAIGMDYDAPFEEQSSVKQDTSQEEEPVKKVEPLESHDEEEPLASEELFEAEEAFAQERPSDKADSLASGENGVSEEDKSKKDASKEDKKDAAKEDKKAENDGYAGFTDAELEAMLFSSSTSGSKKPAQGKKHAEKVVEPLVTSSAAGVSMGGNPYHAEKLSKKGRQEVKAEVIEPMIASSTAASNLGAKPSGRGDKPDRKPVSEPALKKSSDKITGDKGNRYYGDTLDKSTVVEPLFGKSTAHVTGDKGNRYHSDKLDQSSPGKEKPQAVPVVETMSASSAGVGLSSSPGHAPGVSSHKPTPVEEPMMVAKAGSVSMAALPVSVPKISKSKDHPTGDKGNVYHSAKLDQSNKDKGGKVEPVIHRSTGHPAGDKGNPYHTAHLNQSGKGVPVEAVESKIVSSSGGSVMSGNPYHTSNLGKSTPSTGGKGLPVEEPMIASSATSQTMAASPSHNRNSGKDKKAIVVEPMISKKSDHVTGDHGNKYHSAKLDQSVGGKPGSKTAPVVEPLFAKSSGHVTGDKGNPYHSSKLDRQKDGLAPTIPAMNSRTPPPLDNSLFGDDDTVLDTFGTDFKPADDSKEKSNKTDGKKKTDEKKPGDKKLPSKTELLSDDSLKEKPPPLFGDDDDDDLDWLSK